MAELDILWDLIEKGKKGENKGLSTGLSKLDSIIGGLQPSRYYCISGATSSGKTALVLYLMYRLFKDHPKEPIYLVYFSLEIGAEVLLSKLMQLYVAEEMHKYLTLNTIFSLDMIIRDEDYECLEKAKAWLKQFQDRIIILDKGLNARILYKELLPIVQKWGTLVEEGGKQRFIPNHPKQRIFTVIDHMSLCRPEDGRTLKAEMDLVSAYLVTIKRKYQISPIVLMQQNRDASSVDRRKLDLQEPGLNDMKDSGSMSQDADVVLQLFYPMREKLPNYRGYQIIGDSNTPALGSRFRSIIVSKNRYGEADKVIGTAFYGEVGWFLELPPGKEFNKYEDYTNISKINDLSDTTVKDTVTKDSPTTNITYSF